MLIHLHLVIDRYHKCPEQYLFESPIKTQFSSLSPNTIFKFVLYSQFQLVMLIWCYLRVVFSDPGMVPADWRPPFEEDVIVQSTFPNEHDASDVRDPASVDTGIRQCARCQNWKPPRCHHCSVCKFKITFHMNSQFLRLEWCLISYYGCSLI